MLNRHAHELLSRLERVLDIGAAEIRNEELRRWYGQQRITKNVWRDLHDRWLELEADVPLLVGWFDGGWLLVWGEGLQASEDSWLKDVAERANRDFTQVGEPVR